MENFLPGFDAVKPVSTGSPGSLRDAARPWAATIDAGNQLSKIGDRGVELAIKQKEIETKRKAAEMEIEFAQIESDYKKQMLQNPNMTTEEASQGWEKVSSQFLERYNNENMSPLERDTIGLRAASLAQRGSNNVTETALVANIQRGVQAATNLIAEGKRTSNYEMVDNGFAMLRTYKSKEEVESLVPKVYHEMDLARVRDDIKTNPLETSPMFLDKSTFLKANPTLTENDYHDMLAEQQQSEDRYYNQVLDTFNNLTVPGGELNDPGKIPGYFPKVAASNPAFIKKMQDMLTKNREEANKAVMEKRKNDPEWQKATAEMLLSMAQIWVPSKIAGGDFIKADIQNRADHLLGQGTRWHQMVIDAINQKEQITETANKSMFQAELDAFLQAYDRDNENRETVTQTTTSAIATGFLSQARMEKVFDKDTAETIAQIYKPYKEDGSANYSDPSVAADARKKQVEMFRVLWPKRKNKELTDLSQMEIDMLRAIFQGKSGDVVTRNLVLDDTYHRDRGAIIAKMNLWASSYPELAKDPKQVKEYFGKLKTGNLRKWASEQ